MRRGFTLIELLVVIAIVAILAALLIPGLLGAGEQAKIAQAKKFIADFEIGVGSFIEQNPRLPVPPKDEGSEPWGTADLYDNMVEYIEFEEAQLGEDPDDPDGFIIVDPWKTEWRYRRLTDLNASQRISEAFPIRKKWALWSAGPDQEFIEDLSIWPAREDEAADSDEQEYFDDIRSWGRDDLDPQSLQ